MDKDLMKAEEFVFDDSVKKNKKGEAILGTLEGPCADIINPTRNDRQYDEELWENVFNDPIINEYFDCGGILGELDHPSDRIETCTEKVAICMPEKPTKGKDGKLYAKFHILDTPNGRIAHTLAKYGYKLGISSRGNGDVYDAYDGKEHVDASTYELKGFDLVLLPAVKAARLKLTESVQRSLKVALQESLNRADPASRKIMEETLNNLNIEYKQSEQPSSLDRESKASVEYIDANEVEDAAVDNGAELMENLQESLRKNQALEAKILDLQEKLSVCYAKEAKQEEMLTKYKSSVITLSESAKAAKGLKQKVDSLTEQLAQKDAELTKTSDKITALTESFNHLKQKYAALGDARNATKVEIVTLNESLTESKRIAEADKLKLTEQVNDLKQDAAIKQKEYSSKLERANKLVERYKNVAKSAVTRYIESKAVALGVSSNEITNKLSENYTFEDIDRICEELQDYVLNINKLPFNLSKDTKPRVKITESKEPIKPTGRFDDDIDDSLIKLAKNI